MTSGTLALWFAEQGLSYHTIGLFSLTHLPYTLKFLWAPFIDRIALPYLTKALGRRRSWLLASQTLLISGLLGFSCLNPATDLKAFIGLSLIITFAAATQDTVMIAYQMESLRKPQYGPGESASILGYRLGMLVSGAGALSLASFLSWSSVYRIMSLGVAVGLITVLCIAEPPALATVETRERQRRVALYLRSHPPIHQRYAEALAWLYATVTCPFMNFIKKKGWLACLLLMALFKLSDSLTAPMTNIYLLEVGFSKLEIAGIAKLWGGIALVTGGIMGGLMVKHWGYFKSIMLGLLAHTLTHVLYVLLLYTGPSYALLCFITVTDHLTAGVRTTALFAYQFVMTSAAYAATQLALMGSATNLGRTLASSVSGWLVELLGWKYFFMCTSLAILPSLLLVVRLLYSPRNQ